MANPKVDRLQLAAAEQILRQHQALKHLRARSRGALLVIESGPTAQPFPHARLRRVSVQYFVLEMPTHTGKWQTTPFRGAIAEILPAAIETFGWMFQDPERT